MLMLQQWAVSQEQLVSLLCSHLTVMVHVPPWWVPPSVTERERTVGRQEEEGRHGSVTNSGLLVAHHNKRY